MIARLKKIPFPNKLFLVLALVFGLLMIKTVPPLQAPDEVGHFAKAVAFSEFKIQPKFFSNESHEKTRTNKKNWNTFGFKLPKEIKSMNSYSLDKAGKYEKPPYHYIHNKKANKEGREWVPTGGITNYHFFSYLPQIIGISFGKVLGKPIIEQYYAARYFNLIAYIVIVSFAIWKFPFSKLGATVLALNPMALFLASSTSGDGMIIAVSFLFIAWLLSLIKKQTISNPMLLFSGFLMVVLVLMKPTLITLGLLFFLIPNKSFNPKRKAVWGIAIFIASIFFYVTWNKLMIDQQTLYRDFANPGKQLTLFLKKPAIFFDNFHENYLFGIKGDDIIYSFVGNFGLLDTPLGLHWIIVYIISFILAALVQEEKSTLAIHQRVILITMLVAYTFLTFFALYQIWNKVGRTDAIEGVQGRYFIPVSLSIIPLFSSKEKLLNIKPVKINMIVSGLLFLVLVATIVILTTRYPTTF
ncbi:DUF2142 domain-containing protein [Enterococcus dongliensis]|uniref:DUF2142 domain-containing protein n=2 Tax=Enterococcus dongliensis TaxID=2559925 RepID=UPI00288E26CF|nr:DUF2142 domain-containing protein [Enterococcus dongliensis]MDT2674713.1 DUF2142 domain-containing protein [Enterococcus dongliensis]